MVNDRLAGHRACPRHQVEYPRRHPGLIDDGRQLERREGGDLGRLEHYRAARSQCWGDFPGGHQQRVVPWNDRASHPDRLLHCLAGEALIGQGDHLRAFAIALLGQVRVKIEAASGIANIPECFRQWLAVVQYLQARNFLLAMANALGNGTQVLGPLRPAEPWPAVPVEGAPGGFHCQVHVMGCGASDLLDRLLGGRVSDLLIAAFCRGYPLPVDVKHVSHIGYLPLSSPS